MCCSIEMKLNLWISCWEDDLNGVGIFRTRAILPASTSMFIFVPAIWLILTVVSMTARGRGLGEWAREMLGTLIPRKTRHKETVTITAHQSLLFVMGILEAVIEAITYTKFP